MSDIISRKAAIDIVQGYSEQLQGYIGMPNDSEVYAYARGLLLSIDRNIKALPSAQPELSQAARDIATILENEKDMRVIKKNAESESCADTISRKAAIDAVQHAFDRETLLNSFVRKVAVDALKTIPSAQPEDKCGECDAWNQYKNYPRHQWIPVSDRLPDEEVLCCDTRGEMIIGYPYQDEESNTGYSAVDEDLDDVVMIDCTAWMPLPEPYTEDGREK